MTATIRAAYSQWPEYWFRWLAIEQGAKMAEFDLLLDALAAPVEDDEDTPSEESPPNA